MAKCLLPPIIVYFGQSAQINHLFSIRLANMSQDIISASVFYQLLVCASIIALNLLALETQNWLSLERIVSIYEVLVYIALTFLYCNVSDTVTTNLYDIGDTFFGCLWYTLPLAQQKLFILPIQRSQRRFHLTGLGLVDCSLRNFLSVLAFIAFEISLKSKSKIESRI